MNETVGREFFFDFMRRFTDKYPDMHFDIMIGNSAEIRQALVNGQIEIVIGYAMDHKGLKSIINFELKPCIILRTDHPLATRTSVRLADIVSEPFIMPAEDMVLRQVIDELFAKLAVKPTSVITANSFELIKAMVAEGFGVGCQLRITGGPDDARPNIVNVPVRDPKMKPSFLACCISDKGTPSISLSVCVEELRIALQKWYGVQPRAPTANSSRL
jgi:DNA-binding transcriptional LysR family regulator